jgi:hypothetical protein
MIIIKHPDRWFVFYDDQDDGERELFRVQLPEAGCTQAELEKFLDHIKREVQQRETEPS